MNCFKNLAAEWGRGEAGVAHQVLRDCEKGGLWDNLRLSLWLVLG